MTTNRMIRLLFSILLIPIGAVFILLSIEGTVGDLLSKIGLSFIVAGVVSTFHESVIKPFDGHESACRVADEVHLKLKETPLSAVGIRLVSPVRKGYSNYYLWALDNDAKEMFFAGRSVLHRIDEDFEARGIGTAEKMIVRRLTEGASFKIMFVDPRSDLIPRLAKEEGQTTDELLSNVARSLGICIRIYNLLQHEKTPSKASLDILVFDEVPYFAYHRVGSEAIIGFYFTSNLGHASAAFEVVDRQTKHFFSEHFVAIFGRACDQFLVRINQHNKRPELNHHLVNELRKKLSKVLGEQKTTELIEGQLSSVANS